MTVEPMTCGLLLILLAVVTLGSVWKAHRDATIALAHRDSLQREIDFLLYVDRSGKDDEDAEFGAAEGDDEL